jgi:hypothetical protein
VIRLTYRGKAIMFAGDAVGRNEGDPNDAPPFATERSMLENRAAIRIDADVLVAPHHGADNASSAAFIAAVKPTWVVFSAGHKFGHPRKRTAGRYLAAGVKTANMFRTDLMDDEGPEEWALGRVAGHKDPTGDDDVDIVLGRGGVVRVEYREAANQQHHLTAASGGQ